MNSRGFLFINPQFLIVLRTELANYSTCLPHFAVAQGSQLFLKTLAIAGL